MSAPNRTIPSIVLAFSFSFFATYGSAQSPPSASEAFKLRRECKKLSDEKLQENMETNSALKWQITEAWNSSKYDPVSNRCYGSIHLRMVKPANRLDHQYDQVFDLQTDDLLASASIQEGKKSGNIFDHEYNKPWLPTCSPSGCGPDFGEKTWQATEDYINEFMADPRRQ